MDCQNRIKVTLDQDAECGHEASTELDNGLPVCPCCALIEPMLKSVRAEVEVRIKRALATGLQGQALIRSFHASS